jgi:hypothetical protein
MLNASTKSNLLKKEFVETYHTNHNCGGRTTNAWWNRLMSFDSQHILFYFSSPIFDNTYFSLLMLTLFRDTGDQGSFRQCASKSSFQPRGRVGVGEARSRKKNRLSQSVQRAGQAQPTQWTLHFVHKCRNVTNLCFDLLLPDSSLTENHRSCHEGVGYQRV